MVLKRSPGSLLDASPFDDVALAHFESVEGVTDIRIDRSAPTETESTFALGSVRCSEG